MKKLIAVLLSVLLAMPAMGATITVNVRDLMSGTVKNRRVTVTLVQPGPVALGNWVFAGDSVSKFTDATGVATFTNMLTLGSYRMDIQGAPGRSYLFCISSTNGTQNVVNLLGDCTTNTVVSYYTADQVDALIGATGTGNGDVTYAQWAAANLTNNSFVLNQSSNAAYLATNNPALFSAEGALTNNESRQVTLRNSLFVLSTNSVSGVTGAVVGGGTNAWVGLGEVNYFGQKAAAFAVTTNPAAASTHLWLNPGATSVVTHLEGYVGRATNASGVALDSLTANLDGSNIVSGTVAPARLGTGSGGSTRFLREDQSWQTIPGGGDALTSGSLAQFTATTSAQLAGVVSDETGTGKAVFNSSPDLTNATAWALAREGLIASDGLLATNRSTGNWVRGTNGVLTLGPTNSAATITLNGSSGNATLTTVTASGNVSAGSFSGTIYNGGVIATNTSIGTGISWSPGDDGVYITGDLYADAFHGVLPAGSLSGSVDGAHGGGGDTTGMLKGNGAGLVTAATAGTDYLTPASTNGFIRSGEIGPFYVGEFHSTNAYYDQLFADELYVPYTNATGLATDGNGKVIAGSGGTVLTNFFDVRDYGVLPNSPATSANGPVARAILAAELVANATNPAVVFFPPGNYYYTETNAYTGFTSETYPSLIGIRSNGVVLYGPSSRHVANANMSTAYNFLGIGGVVSGVNVATTNNAVIGLEFDEAGKANVIDFTQCYYNYDLTFRDCKFYNGNVGGDAIDVQSGGSVWVQDCKFFRIEGNAVSAQNSMVQVSRCYIEDCGHDLATGGTFSMIGSANYVNDTVVNCTNWWDTLTSATFDNCSFASLKGEPAGNTNAVCGSGANIILVNCTLNSSANNGGAMIRANANSSLSIRGGEFTGNKAAIFNQNAAGIKVSGTTFSQIGHTFWGGGWAASGAYVFEGCNMWPSAANAMDTVRVDLPSYPLHNLALTGNRIGRLYADQTDYLTNWVVRGNEFYAGADMTVDYSQGWEVTRNIGNTNTVWGTAGWGRTNVFTGNRFGVLRVANTDTLTNYFFDNYFGAIVSPNQLVWSQAIRSGNKDWNGVNYDVFTGNGSGLTNLTEAVQRDTGHGTNLVSHTALYVDTAKLTDSAGRLVSENGFLGSYTGNGAGLTNVATSNLVGTVWGGISNAASGGANVTILPNGNVGIGTATPDKNLEINSATGANLRLTYNDSNGSAANYVDFNTSSSGALTVTPSGRNTEFVGSVALLGIPGVVHGTLNVFNNSGVSQLSIVGSTEQPMIYSKVGAPLVFGINSNEKMRLDSTGNVGIGTTAPVGKLDVNGALNATTVNATNGYYMPSNSVAAWPTAPRTPGEAYWGNSNGTTYLLQSGLGLTWISTNKIGQ